MNQILTINTAGQGKEITDFKVFLSTYGKMTNSQLAQDLWILFETKFKQGGTFIDFGSTDGKAINNTLLLEEKYGWYGVLAEPARCWASQLQENRRLNYISTKCVYSKSGLKIPFTECYGGAADLSTLTHLVDSDSNRQMRQNGFVYDVETISLNDLIEESKIGSEIDYLSIDTEGSELDVLAALDFSKYKIKYITVEHNFTDNRGKIYDLLVSKGYQRKFAEVSAWDDWYVLS